MLNQTISPVILSGGVGARLWPASRTNKAKQFVPLIWEETLLQKTLTRLTACPNLARATVIGSQKDRFALREQLEAIKSDADVVLEPARRDTFAAVVLAAEVVAMRDPDAIVAVMPADHLIPNADTFASALKRASAAVATSGIAVIGIEPTAPSTAYGYIMPGPAMGPGVFAVEKFIEKPDVETAEQLITAHDCRWNAGIFCFRAGWLIEEVRTTNPDLLAAVSESVRTGTTVDDAFIPSDAFLKAQNISFDHGFMEKTDKALVVPASFSWSDVGDWNAIWQTSEKDENGVAAYGDTINLRSKNTLVHATSRLVCTVGVSNIAVIETADSVLVLSLDDAQGVKELAKHLDNLERSEASEHARTSRPWGWYQTVDLGERFRVKRINVKPGAQLSLQRHHHRAEHWTIVRGTAEVTIGNKVHTLTENESTYIPLGEIHRVSNPGRIPLEMIEVQTGGYLEEDDIERLEDDFGRVVPLSNHELIAAE